MLLYSQTVTHSTIMIDRGFLIMPKFDCDGFLAYELTFKSSLTFYLIF